MIIGPDDYTAAACKSLLKMLEVLVDEGFLKNNCELGMPSADGIIAPFERALGSRFLQVIYSMNNLEKLDIMEYDVTVADLAHLFQSCPNITHLHLKVVPQDIWNTKDDLSQNQLRLGFQKLQLFEIIGSFLPSGNQMLLKIFPYV